MDTKSQIVDIPISGKPKKRSTGIVGLNLLLDGGFPTGTVIMVYGSPLAGVDLAAMQFWKVEGEEGTYLMNDGDVETGMQDVSEIHPEMYLPQMIGGRIVVDSLSTIIIKYGIDVALKFLRKCTRTDEGTRFKSYDRCLYQRPFTGRNDADHACVGYCA